MDSRTAQRLAQINTAFYERNAASFSATRQHPWQGWRECLRIAREQGVVPTHEAADAQVSVLDVACGNLRFERFLAGEAPAVRFAVHAVDNCDGLVSAQGEASYQSLDVCAALLTEPPVLSTVLRPLACDLVVCFGFLHHVPTFRARLDLLRTLTARTRPGGLCLVSAWRFDADERLRTRAPLDTARAAPQVGIDRADLDAGDYLLGWQGRPDAWRYCHCVDDVEVDCLVKGVVDDALLVRRFRADGPQGRSNEYLALTPRAS
ncbi:class I SAM-dependent methyltransferase [Berryella wangjianweii]|uniref:Class I SAM-dependent methyltransferase n=1 Tax=Berryella wangjianweii TaxID=2734634 RepID=A0A6M8J5Z5_9ACTN|nr:class I SAM-dependent methyltransferase [Berryella wangjianweii]QKF06889.1 class I SAM-dependent methyltransferase [Berryella wangjianweii]